MQPDEQGSELEQKPNQSPVPANNPTMAGMKEADFPICHTCTKRVEQIRHLAYEEFTVVFHAECGAVLGVVPTKSVKKKR